MFRVCIDQLSFFFFFFVFILFQILSITAKATLQLVIPHHSWVPLVAQW